ncbi:MAG TPA: N-6 DNA methylase [Chloroflexaceae bacterium]|nr:N-6 DNA methylase [Chloroflexaceae bacterium]
MAVNFSKHKALDTYDTAIATYGAQGVTHEQATRLAFSTLLDTLSKTVGWTLVLEQTLANRKRPDGTLVDSFKIPRGYWEAKDTQDDLDAEIQTKIRRGYPLSNTIFEDTRRAVLYQGGRPAFEADLSQRGQLVALLNAFFGYTGAQIEEFHAAVREFQERIPELARGLLARIEEERGKNKRFVGAFAAFHEICKQAIDPQISVADVEVMLVQHLLTERLFRTIFDNPDFTRRNVIAAEIEKVIDALTSRAFNRRDFLKALDYFYLAIEDAAATIADFAQKQTFLNTVYERFFQGFSKDQADTHGIVYTPQPIVDFMVASVDEVLQREFGKSLSTPGVKILDPSTGTGNFVVNILRRLNRRDLKTKYREDLFANEIMLLPYYIAALNIEHAYYELTGEYEPFEGICFTDTLDLAESQQLSLFAEENTERVERQKNAEITVIIGNPPYNVGQRNENDNNKNRKYLDVGSIDQRVKETYVKDSKATNRNKLGDPYVKFFRWATDRLRGKNGIVCFVSNNSFIDQIVYDGMRKHLLQDFTHIYHIDLHGDVRRNTKLSGTTHNVFSIQVGVGITIAVRNSSHSSRVVRYFRVPEMWTTHEKLSFLRHRGTIQTVEWNELTPNNRHVWLTQGMREEFAEFLPIGSKEAKAIRLGDAQTLFKTYSLGVSTNRDDVVYDFNSHQLCKDVVKFVEAYNAEVSRWQRAGKPRDIDSFVAYESIKWSRNLKDDLRRGRLAEFNTTRIRNSLYRPYCKRFLYFDTILNEEVYGNPTIFPDSQSERENRVIIVSDHGHRAPFSTLVASVIPNLHALAASDGFQCFPFYVYDEDGGNRRENITDWALGQFQARYGAGVTKRDIFHYVYAVLHHPQYRERYAENLKRELPRLPFVAREEFQAFADAGAKLAELHLGYEAAPEYPLRWVENKAKPFSWRVTKMKLTPAKDALVVNESLTLAGIPPACFEYRLGNRSALEWVIDQYQVSTDRRSGITSDPNRDDDEEYIVRLVGRVVTVSVETVRLIKSLPAKVVP